MQLKGLLAMGGINCEVFAVSDNLDAEEEEMSQRLKMMSFLMLVKGER